MNTQYIILFLFLIIGCQEEIGLSGKVNGNKEHTKIYLLQVKSPQDFYNGSNSLVIDSAAIDDVGKFHFPNFNQLDINYIYRLNIVYANETPGMIKRDYQHNNYVFLTNDGNSVYIEGDADALSQTYTISPQKKHEAFIKLRDSEQPFYQLNKKLQPQYEAYKDNPEQLAALREKYFEQVMTLLDSLLPEYKSMLDSEADPRVVSLLMNHINFDGKLENDLTYFEPIIEKLDPSHPYTQWWKEEIYKEKFILPKGTKAPDLQANTVSGESKKLYNIKAKLILLDFWASWCSPCRKENREVVVPLHQKYASKGFEVVGVSLDDKKKNWENAIEKDGLRGVQLSDLQGKKSPLWRTFKIDQLPTTYLLNENFKIVAKDIRDEELKAFVEEYLNEKTE